MDRRRGAMAAMNWAYRVSGLTISAERPLPYLHPWSLAGEADARIIFAPVPEREAARGVGPFQIHAPDLVDLALPGRPIIRIEGGRSITVAPQPEMGEGELQTLLFGPAFAVLLHQRGQPPLHAGAVRVGEGAIAIAGHSGAGKSTTTRALVRRGYGFLCDDQLVVEPETGLAHPGFPAMKLWSRSAQFFGDGVVESSRVRPGFDKFHISAGEAFAPEAVPLQALFVLVPDPSIQQPEVERLKGPLAVAALGELVHFSEVAAAMGDRRPAFLWASLLAGCVPIYRVPRRDDLDGLDRLIDDLLHLAG